jgi:hypothetical protein
MCDWDFETEGWEDRWVEESPFLDGNNKSNDIPAHEEDDTFYSPLPGEEEQ